eukprot:m.107311 g.107311  ORF g.107311 m.107311 type:complete len:342 (-) comp19039_c0_seq3:69-1094(-)
MSDFILVTGGAGYIGSHTLISMVEKGYKPVVVDNLVNSSEESLVRVKEITGQEIPFVKADLLDRAALEELFSKWKFSGVIHFAGLKAVGESTRLPLLYYHNNITGSLILFETMAKFGVKNLVFSSSATVYGDPVKLPIDETHPVGGCTNPYGKTKYFIEEILRDMALADKDWNIVILRYFNPVGAHESGKIGEDPQGIPNNLVPYISQVAVGKREALGVFGNDYDTPDGTGVRDYIHVVDLAKGHVCALKRLEEKCGCVVYNLGSGNGYSVFDMVKAFGEAAGKEIPYKVLDRRPGDIATCYADASKAFKEMGWKTEKTLKEMCADGWRWQSNNPNGYKTA